MSRIRSLAWKEWRELRAFLWIGLGVFLGLPLIGAVESHGFHFEATPWIVTFGGVLAVFAAVGSTCRDFTGHLEDFWRSRPISISRWLLLKYFVGLAVVLVACVSPLALEVGISRQTNARMILELFPFFWAAIYSLGFLAGCLLRRTAPAAMFALGGLLLMIFLPIILPPLRWLDGGSLTSSSEGALCTRCQRNYIAGMLCMAIVLLSLALLAANRGWRIESGLKMMYGSVSLAILILFASAAFQLGTNLPIIKQIDLSEGEEVTSLNCDGQRGYVISMKEKPSAQGGGYQYMHRTIEINGSQIKLGSPGIGIGEFEYYSALPLPDNPYIKYIVAPDSARTTEEKVSYVLDVASLDTEKSVQVARLWEEDRKQPRWPMVYAKRNRLFVIGSHLIILDIDEPLKPKILSDVPFYFPLALSDDLLTTSRRVISLPPVPGLSPRERLELAMQQFWYTALEGDTICSWNTNDLLIYRLTNLTDQSARLEETDRYEPTLLERVFGSNTYGQLYLQNGLLYVGQHAGPDQTFNAHVVVFDTRRAGSMRPIGHFAAPGSWSMASCPLPDGRALIGGNKLWLVGPPPLH